MRKINLIVIHCSATRSNQRFTYEMLKKCHDARFHGKGIAYHYYIEKDGQVYQTRDEEEIGMHARHYNAHSIQRYPHALIVGHHDLNPQKDCPCFDAAKEYLQL